MSSATQPPGSSTVEPDSTTAGEVGSPTEQSNPSAIEAKNKGKGKEKEKKSIGDRLFKRAKTILRKKDGSLRFPIPYSKAGTAEESTVVKPAVPETVGPVSPKAVAPAVSETVEPVAPEAVASKRVLPAGVQNVPKIKVLEERAISLGVPYGLIITLDDLKNIEGDVQRVEREVRVRIHRSCHLCKTMFGCSHECPKCNHVCCKKCPPPPKTKEQRKATKARVDAMKRELKANAPIQVDWYAHLKKHEPVVLIRKPGKQDLIYKKARQRVRRTCHECEAVFHGSNLSCPKCGHRRCTDCPRIPYKKEHQKKYPYGYPGDEFSPNSIPYHKCHKCKKVFPGGVEDGVKCKSCEHPKCSECPRMKPQKVEPEQDPEVIKSMQAKLEALKLTTGDNYY